MSGNSTGTRIGTHNKTFSCSQVLACALLKLLPQYNDASIVRSQDQNILDTCDIVVDVGGEYDHSRHRYDHRMRDFQKTASIINQELNDWILDLSAAGLIYCHFGRDILRNVLSDLREMYYAPEAIIIGEIFKIVYFRLIKEIDARDNGPQIYSSPCDLNDLSERIYRLNPCSDSRDEEKDQQFEKAMALVREEFLEVVQNAKKVDYRQIVHLKMAVGSRSVVDSSGEIIMLSASVPASVLCEDLLSYIEEDMNVSSSIKYVILEPGWESGIPYWKIACILVALRSYTEEYRMLLPQKWAGLENNALVEACGVRGAIRVDPDRRIGIHGTKWGAIVMALEALKIGKTAQSEE